MTTPTYEHIKERQETLKAGINKDTAEYSKKCKRAQSNIFRLEMHPLFDPTISY